MPELRIPERSAYGTLSGATLAALAIDEVLQLGSARSAADLAERAIAVGLPPEPHRAWAGLALVVDLSGAEAATLWPVTRRACSGQRRDGTRRRSTSCAAALATIR